MGIMPVSPGLTPSTSPTPVSDLLLVDATPEAAQSAAILRGAYRVSTTTSTDAARQFLHRHAPAIVVTDLHGVDGVEICREAKSLSVPLPVLVTTTDIDRVPDALTAGCDGVLLKPFAPNLLIARIGRLLRSQTGMLRARVRHQAMKSAHLTDRTELLRAGTNRVWPNTYCPYCDHAGVTSFEFCSHRLAWYACIQCRKVWIARRQE